MKHFILLLALLLPLSSFAATGSGNVSSVIGLGQMSPLGVPTSYVPLNTTAAPSVFTVLCGADSNASAGNYYPCYKNGAAFSTGANKKAYCFNGRVKVNTTNIAFQFVSATASFTFNQSSALTGGVYSCGADLRYCIDAGPTAGVYNPIPGVFTFGDGTNDTFIGWQSGYSTQVFKISMECYTI